MSETTTTLSVRCNHCGAPLAVSSSARFLTCTYCGAQLEIRREGGALYTQLLSDVDQRTQKIERDVEQIKRQNEIEQLDREWALRAQSLMVRSKDGSSHIPSAAGSLIGGAIAVIGGILWTAFAFSMGAPIFFPLFGLLFIGAGIVAAIGGLSRADVYRREEQEYRQRREALLREMDGEAEGGER